MVRQTGIEKRIHALQQVGLQTRREYASLMQTIAEAEFYFNDQAARFYSSGQKGKNIVGIEIARHFLESINQVRFLTEDGLASVIVSLLDSYRNDDGTPNRRIVDMKRPSTGKFSRVFGAVHPLMNPELSNLLEWYLPGEFTDNSAQAELRLLVGFNHDVPEDLEESKKIPIEKTIARLANQYDSLFWKALPSEEAQKHRQDFSLNLASISRPPGLSFESYLLGLYVTPADNSYVWHDERTILENGLFKFRDSFDNGVNQGRFRSLQLQDPWYDHTGLTNSDRMVGNLKSAALINLTADLLSRDVLSEDTSVQMVSWLYLQTAVTLHNLNQIIRGVKREYKDYPQYKMIQALERAILEHTGTSDILSANPQEQDLQYYLDGFRKSGSFPPELFNGTIQVIAARMNRLHKEPLYANLTMDYHLLKFMTHVYGVRAMLERTITDNGFNVVSGFANLPAEISKPGYK